MTLSQLNPRDQELMRLLADGLTNQQIANKMHTTRYIVVEWLRVLYEEMGFESRVQAALWYIYQKELQNNEKDLTPVVHSDAGVARI